MAGSRKSPRAVLVLVGGTEYGRNRTMRETPFMAQLRRDLARAPGRVVLTGFIPPADMPRTYLLGDVLWARPRSRRASGWCSWKPAAAGLPIIATARGGIPEVVRDGFNGLLLRQPDDEAELAEKSSGSWATPRSDNAWASRAGDWVCADFSWEKIARDLEEFYDEVMDQNRHGQYLATPKG